MTATYSGIHPERFFGVDGYVGNIPLIRLRRLSELTGFEILGKAEFWDPRAHRRFSLCRLVQLCSYDCHGCFVALRRFHLLAAPR
jgi:hypothetical protein